MTYKAINAADALGADKIGVIDVFMLEPLNEKLFCKFLRKYKCVITIEEGFINKGGLDSLVSSIIDNNGLGVKLQRMGFNSAYVFDIGNREHLHALNKLDEKSIIRNIRKII